MNNGMEIPKIIHYCWFGGKDIPNNYKKYMLSWRKFFPEYKIVRWDESNFNISSNNYVKEAYKSKKWAFVSDFARFQILYRHGGLYFDTDVEVIKPFDDIISNGSFMGMEIGKITASGCNDINPGLGLAAAPGLNLYKELLEGYKDRHFIKQDGTYDLTTIVDYTTDIMKKKGFDPYSEQTQTIEGIYIYPPEYFCPLNFSTRELNITEATHSIHHYDASWIPLNSRINRKIKTILGPEISKHFVAWHEHINDKRFNKKKS